MVDQNEQGSSAAAAPTDATRLLAMRADSDRRHAMARGTLMGAPGRAASGAPAASRPNQAPPPSPAVVEPFGYFRELLGVDAARSGVFVGCANLRAAELVFAEGETGKEIIELFRSSISANCAVLEQVAQQWDGCMCEAAGQTLNVGTELRRQFAAMFPVGPDVADQPGARANARGGGPTKPARHGSPDWTEADRREQEHLDSLAQDDLAAAWGKKWPDQGTPPTSGGAHDDTDSAAAQAPAAHGGSDA